MTTAIHAAAALEEVQRGEAPGGGGGAGGGLRGDLEREDAELAGLRARRRALEAQLDDFAAAAADDPAATATGTATATATAPRRKAAWKVRQEMRWRREAAVAEAAELRREQEALFYAAPAPIPVAADRRPTPTPKEKDKKKKKDYAARAFAAIAAGDAAALARLLQRRRVGANVVDAATGDAALAAAATAGHAEVLELLCDAGADPNRRNPRTGNTVSRAVEESSMLPRTPFLTQAPSPQALHCCFAAGQFALADWLIARGADDGLENAAGLSCYDLTPPP